MKFSISLLALCGAACALSFPRGYPSSNVAKIVDAQEYMSGNETSIASDVEKRTLGTVFMCNAAFFSGYCVGITGAFNGGCNLGVDLDNQSFGPGQRCQLFNAHDCATSGAGTPAWSGPIAFPGIQDFSVSWVDANGNVNAPFNDIISSYRCNW
ncbi:hypothetical protein C8R43DRAFT_1234565 [Mycena crocata]|nr:hypothetical protein C8R43DRAFT_1234565 [Mycena crocata]